MLLHARSRAHLRTQTRTQTRGETRTWILAQDNRATHTIVTVIVYFLRNSFPRLTTAPVYTRVLVRVRFFFFFSTNLIDGKFASTNRRMLPYDRQY